MPKSLFTNQKITFCYSFWSLRTHIDVLLLQVNVIPKPLRVNGEATVKIRTVALVFIPAGRGHHYHAAVVINVDLSVAVLGAR